MSFFTLPVWNWNEYKIEYRYYGKRVIKTHVFCDAEGERRRVGDTVTIEVNREKRIGIVMEVV